MVVLSPNMSLVPEMEESSPILSCMDTAYVRENPPLKIAENKVLYNKWEDLTKIINLLTLERSNFMQMYGKCEGFLLKMHCLGW